MREFARSILVAGAFFLLGCRQLGFRRVDEDIYISRSVPSLERVAQEISTARREARSSEAADKTLPELTVDVDSRFGLGPEEFRILAEKDAVRVEGGDWAGAFYGSLEVARRIREGRGALALQVSHAGPKFRTRVLRTAIGLPGLSASPAPLDWKLFLDKVAFARFNTILAFSGHPFPWLTKLTRFPKAFEGLESEATVRKKAFHEFLSLALERNVRVIVAPTDLRIPESFLRNYAEKNDRSALTSLARSYLKECIGELLLAYPQLAGVGIGAEALSGIPEAQVDELVRSVYGEGIRASGESAYLYVSSDASSRFRKTSLPAGVAVIEEIDLSPSILFSSPERRAAGSTLSSRICGRLPWLLLSPCLPVPEQCSSLLEKAATHAPDGFALDLFDPSAFSGAAQNSMRRYLFEREAFLAASFGLSSYEPPMEMESWAFLWKDFSGEGAQSMLDAAVNMAAIWPELALFHPGGPAWSPLTSIDAGGKGGRAGSLRDEAPFVSLVEFVFSRTAHSNYISIPEFVASEFKGAPLDPARRPPLQVAETLLDKSAACFKALGGSSQEKGETAGSSGGPPSWAPRAELEGYAHLGAFHAHRIRAGVFLLRHVAGLERGAQDRARSEIAAAISSWSLAEAAFFRLRRAFGDSTSFPDMTRWRVDAERDASLVEEAQPDPAGFRSSPLFTAWPLSPDFDFGNILGFLHFPGSVLDHPGIDFDGGGQLIEAEDFAGAWTRLKAAPGYSGEGYVSSGALGRKAELPMTVRLRLTEAGKAYFWLRTLQGGGGDSKAVRLEIRGPEGSIALPRIEGTNAGPERFLWERGGEAAMPQGEVFLQILDDGPGREGVDAVVITLDKKWIPPSF